MRAVPPFWAGQPFIMLESPEQATMLRSPVPIPHIMVVSHSPKPPSELQRCPWYCLIPTQVMLIILKASLSPQGRIWYFSKWICLNNIFLNLTKPLLMYCWRRIICFWLHFHLVQTVGKEWSVLIRHMKPFHSPRIEPVTDTANRGTRLSRQFLLKKSSTSPS